MKYQLSSKLPQLSANDAFAAMRSVGLAELDFAGQTERFVSAGGRDARRILAALGIKQIDPPAIEEGTAEGRKMLM